MGVIRSLLFVAFLTTPVAMTMGEGTPNRLAMPKKSLSTATLLATGPGLIVPGSLLLKSSPSLVMTRFLKIGFRGLSDLPSSAINILIELLPISMDAIRPIIIRGNVQRLKH